MRFALLALSLLGTAPDSQDGAGALEGTWEMIASRTWAGNHWGDEEAGNGSTTLSFDGGRWKISDTESRKALSFDGGRLKIIDMTFAIEGTYVDEPIENPASKFTGLLTLTIDSQGSRWKELIFGKSRVCSYRIQGDFLTVHSKADNKSGSSIVTYKRAKPPE